MNDGFPMRYSAPPETSDRPCSGTRRPRQRPLPSGRGLQGSAARPALPCCPKLPGDMAALPAHTSGRCQPASALPHHSFSPLSPVSASPDPVLSVSSMRYMDFETAETSALPFATQCELGEK